MTQLIVQAEGFSNNNGVAKLWVHNRQNQWNKDKDNWDNNQGAFYTGTTPIESVDDVQFVIPLTESIQPILYLPVI